MPWVERHERFEIGVTVVVDDTDVDAVAHVYVSGEHRRATYYDPEEWPEVEVEKLVSHE